MKHSRFIAATGLCPRCNCPYLLRKDVFSRDYYHCEKCGRKVYVESELGCNCIFFLIIIGFVIAVLAGCVAT